MELRVRIASTLHIMAKQWSSLIGSKTRKESSEFNNEAKQDVNPLLIS